MVHPRTRQIQIAEQIVDEVEIMMATDKEFVARIQAERIADLLHQRSQIRFGAVAQVGAL